MSNLLVPAIDTLSPWIGPALAYYELANSKVRASHERRCSLTCVQARVTSLALCDFNVLLPDLPRLLDLIGSVALYGARAGRNVRFRISLLWPYPRSLSSTVPTSNPTYEGRYQTFISTHAGVSHEQINFSKSKLPAGIAVKSMICVSYSRCGLDYGTALLVTGGFNITFTESDDIVRRCIRE